MNFTSFHFLFFLPVLLIVYYGIPKRGQWGLLLLVSLGCYGAGGWRYPVFLGFTILSVYTAARILERGKNRGVLLACLAANFGMLAVCKIALGAPETVAGTGLSFLSLGLPMGISFYMFQATGYLLDVYRGRAKAEGNLLKFALFVSYFPQMIQGPISRWGQLKESLFAPHVCNVKEISFGLQRMLLGYFKKLVLADRMAVAVLALRGPEYTGAGFFLLTFCYSIQIYCDFTGGIDMALGLSQALGVQLPENFRRPYFSKNIAEYWRRWHISLGEWMKDYVFYPLSVSRPMLRLARFSRRKWGPFGRRLPVYLASFVTWCVTGLWHGITPNFLVWGILNWAVIVISQELEPKYRRFHEQYHLKNKPWYGAFEIIRMFLLMNLIRACDLFPNVWEYFRRVGSLVFAPSFSVDLGGLGLSDLDGLILVVGCAGLLLISWGQERWGSLRQRLYEKNVIWQYLVFFGLFLAVLLLGRYGVGYDGANFLYNQF